MKIGIDYRPMETAYARRGVGVVIRNLLPRVCRSRIANKLLLMGTSNKNPDYDVSYARIARPRRKRWLFEQLLWPADLIAHKVSLFHSLVSLGPLRTIGYPFVCPAKSIATIYDLNLHTMNEFKAYRAEMHYRIQMRAVRNATRILTISEHAKSDIIRHLSIAQEKITVIPCAIDDRKRQIYDKKSYATTAQRHSYIFALGETSNKNIETVLRVFHMLRDDGYDGKLYVAGAVQNQQSDVLALHKSSPYKECITFTGQLSDKDLIGYYTFCDFFFFPSMYEGFGLPVLEAMYCGAPVLASNAASLPEASGEAALLLEPKDLQGFFDCAKALIENSDIRNKCIERGKEHARKFSWDNAAETLVSLYEEILNI